MKLRIALLCGTALAPFLVSRWYLDVTRPGLVESPRYDGACLVSAIAWCWVFALVYSQTSPRLRRRLWWLAPLVLLACPLLFDRIELLVLLTIATLQGRGPM